MFFLTNGRMEEEKTKWDSYRAKGVTHPHSAVIVSKQVSYLPQLN